MTPEESKAMLAAIKENQRKLDYCPRHQFEPMEPPYKMGQKFECKRCGGFLNAINAYAYVRGYEAHGGNADDVMLGFNGPLSSAEIKVTCPKCKGVCGIETAPNDWFDCDFCSGSGEVNRGEALIYIGAESQP